MHFLMHFLTFRFYTSIIDFNQKKETVLFHKHKISYQHSYLIERNSWYIIPFVLQKGGQNV